MIINGDSREILQSDEFKDLLSGKHPIIVTDPPFNIGYHYGSYKDRMADEDYFEMLSEMLSPYPFVIIHYPESIYQLALKIGKAPKRVVSWCYNSNTAKQHRDIAFFDIEPDFSQVRQPYKNPNDKRVKTMMEKGSLGSKLYDWWNINQVKNISEEKTQHPCQMPAEVMEKIIGILPRNEGGEIVVIDPFMGSGTTGIACDRYGIDFIGIEIDKQYFKIAERRLENERMRLF